MKNVFKFIALSALLMSFALFAGSVFAQTSTTGSIEGFGHRHHRCSRSGSHGQGHEPEFDFGSDGYH
jgi:hypothetical protein